MRTSTGPSTEEVTEWARKLYADGVDKRDADIFADGFVRDGWLRFGNNPPLVGQEAIRTGIAQFFTMMAGVEHESAGTYYVDGTLILEAKVTYTLHQGGTVSVHAVTIFKIADSGPPRAENCRIYVDLTPLFSAVQPI
ncbi:MAG: nuclear transport factor 2 family protein [Gemmatimonadales bacterium]